MQVNVVDILKKSLAFGVGAAAFSAEKLKQFADEMVAKGEMTSEEASKLVEDVSQRAEQEKTSLQNWMHEQMSKMLNQVGAAKSDRVDALESRIAALEKQLGVVGAEPEGVSSSSDDKIPPESA